MLADSRTREESRVLADPELFCCHALGSLPCPEEEEAELWERFLVSIGEDWDWYLEFTWAVEYCWTFLCPSLHCFHFCFRCSVPWCQWVCLSQSHVALVSGPDHQPD